MSTVSEGSTPRATTHGVSHIRPHQHDLRALREILVCVDRSPYSEICVKQAVTIARCLGGSITVVYVMSGARNHAGQATDAVQWEIARQETDAYLGELQANVRREYPNSRLARMSPKTVTSNLRHGVSATIFPCESARSAPRAAARLQ